MIKENELRIGNYVIFVNEIKQVLAISDRHVSYYAVDNINHLYYYLEDIKPIPLTEEILLKCGFEKYVKDNGSIRFVHDNCFYEVEQHGDKFPFVLEDYENYSTIHYICHDTKLHSFQNSFKQLTGEELTVNL